jgi:hypothetical protein
VAVPGEGGVTAVTHAQRDGGEIALLGLILRHRPSLPGALCRGQAPRFDRDALDGETEAERVDRLDAAKALCNRCPERAECQEPVIRVRPRSLPRGG